ncbi:MAG: glycosyltransferase family 4 protein [Planctomycetota bacterium]
MAEDSSPRVLFVDQSGAVGGAELSLFDLVRSRASEGDTVAVLSKGLFVDRLRSASIDTRVLPLAVDVQKASGVLRQLASVPRVLSVAKQLAAFARDHDLLYANTQKAAVVGAIAAWLAGKPMFWHLRDMLDADHFSGANRRIVIAATNRVTRLVVANSHATAEAYRRAGGRVPVKVVYNGVDAKPFANEGNEEAGRLRAELGISKETPLVGAFGRLTPWKGQHVLLDALEANELATVHAAIVGEALFTDEDREYASELRARSSRGSLEGRVHWLGHRDDVATLMRACTMVVHSATQPEPFGRVIVEAMLAGRPVIAANAGGAKEIVADGRTGLLTSPGDAEALATAIGRLVDSPAFAEDLATAGRVDASARFRLEDRVAELNTLIAEAVMPQA